ncbi:MAG: hypothetical protein HY645_05425 [Acidobacteria bacterium]|nr:hypothetical protein [Acidobacteriota bacterium]
MRKLLRLLPLAFVVTSLLAIQPESWSVSTQRDFLKGELKGLSITSDGKLTLAPALEPIFDTQQAFVFSAVQDKSGTLYLGTGNNGKVYRIAPGGKGEEWVTLDQPAVQALAVDSLGRIYAGTAPNGKVYRISAQGESQVFFDPGEDYIWSLNLDAENNLYVATGSRGTVYKVSPEGRGASFFDSTETHLVCLEWDLDKNLLAGSAPNGILYRIAPDGSGFALYDSPLEEIKSISVDRYGQIWAAALGGGQVNQEAMPLPSSGREEQKGGQTEKENPSDRTISVPGSTRGRRLEIYRIDKGDLAETWFSSDDELAFDLLARSDGTLLVGTGNKGRILSLDSRRFATILVQSPEEQVTQLLERAGSVYAVTSNLGKVFEFKLQPASQGIYVSEVLDAKITASWGVIRWFVRNPGSAVPRLYTRSGNTEKPDDTWSPWHGPYSDSNGSAIQSAPARYLQWKIEFPQSARPAALQIDENAVEEVTVFYLQRNVSPRIDSITVHPPGVAFMRYPGANTGGGISPGGPDGAHLRSLPRFLREMDQSSTSPPPRQVFIPAAQSVSWSASDPNADELTFSVYYRSQDESAWKLLVKDLAETSYTFDAAGFSSGTYVLKIIASDLPSNPPGMALESELMSRFFVISNATPTVELGVPTSQGRSLNINFSARTYGSTVYQAEYAIDGGEWKIVFPEDLIADSPVEQYTIRADQIDSGEHTIAVRVIDSVGNVGTGKTVVNVR